MQIIKKFNPLEDEMIQVMNEKGEIINPELMPDVSDEDILSLYKLMRRTRAMDTIALSLQRQVVMFSFV